MVKLVGVVRAAPRRAAKNGKLAVARMALRDQARIRVRGEPFN